MSDPGIQQNANRVLAFFAEQPRDVGHGQVMGQAIADGVDMSPENVNDAVTILEEAGYVDWIRTIGTKPFTFASAGITPRGRFEFERARAEAQATGDATSETLPGGSAAVLVSQVTPSGSPFGFTEQDWEAVASARGAVDRLNVVFGLQFESELYETDTLLENIESMFERAVEAYRELPASLPVTLDFRPLTAGYGEHLFNEIARDIIGADVAVFDTSEQNPNVMIEMGVALTWGVRVLPVRRTDRPPPPSDISGQTWTVYEDSGSRFPDQAHDEKLLRLVQRAIQRKNPRGI